MPGGVQWNATIDTWRYNPINRCWPWDSDNTYGRYGPGPWDRGWSGYLDAWNDYGLPDGIPDVGSYLLVFPIPSDPNATVRVNGVPTTPCPKNTVEDINSYTNANEHRRRGTATTKCSFNTPWRRRQSVRWNATMPWYYNYKYSFSNRHIIIHL